MVKSCEAKNQNLNPRREKGASAKVYAFFVDRKVDSFAGLVVGFLFQGGA